jgi:hypothetical protein
MNASIYENLISSLTQQYFSQTPKVNAAEGNNIYLASKSHENTT